MKKAIALVIVLTASQYLHAQHIEIIKSRLAQLTLQRKSIDDSIQYLSSIVDVVARLENEHPHIHKTVLTTTAVILRSEVYNTTLPSTLNEGDSIVLYDIVANKYLVRSGIAIGYIPRNAVASSKHLKAYDKLLQRDNKSKEKSDPSPATVKKSHLNGWGGSSSGSYQSIQTGPRGGRYYINKNGNKTYVKKK